MLTGVYTMIGGLLAVVWTESIQTVLLLIGAVCITAVGYYHVGGWSGLTHTLASCPHPLAGAADPKMACNWPTGNFLSILRGADDPSEQPWLGILLGYPVIGIWYWCCDQTIVQRILAARDEKQARLGPLFCSFLKILPVFFFILPGVICVALVQQGFFQDAAPANPKDTYTFMVTHMLPWGVKGLVTAAMLAAAMQTCSAALNSTATLFAYDIVKRYRPQTSDHRLVVIGKITTVVGTILAIISSPIFGEKDTVFQALTDIICYVSPPITAVFLMGVFWKRASGWAAFLALCVGEVLGIGIFFLDRFKAYTGWDQVIAWHKAWVGYRLTSMFAGVLSLYALRPDCRGCVPPLPRAIEGRGQTTRVGGLARAAPRRGARARLGQLPHPFSCRLRDIRPILSRFPLKEAPTILVVQASRLPKMQPRRPHHKRLC